MNKLRLFMFIVLIIVLVILFKTWDYTANDSLVEISNDGSDIKDDTTKIDSINDTKSSFEDTKNNDSSEDKLNHEIDDIIATMSLKEKFAQLLIIGINDTELTQETSNFIKDLKPGGIILFSRNIESFSQLKRLTSEIVDLYTDIKPFIAIDQEGGNVNRLSKIFGDLPSQLELGKIDNIDLTKQYGNLTGQMLNICGINLNFSPVVDILSKKNNALSNRCFGDNVEIVEKHSLALVSEMQKHAVIAVPKHFPGHGSTSTDSHFDIPVISKTMDEISDFELSPYKLLIKNNISMIMVGHLKYENLDSDNIASQSSFIMDTVMRDYLKFNGIIISDDFNMGAIEKIASIDVAVNNFFINGGDLALICNDTTSIDDIYRKFSENISTGELSIDDINEKIKKIIHTKLSITNHDELSLDELMHSLKAFKNTIKG